MYITKEISIPQYQTLQVHNGSWVTTSTLHSKFPSSVGDSPIPQVETPYLWPFFFSWFAWVGCPLILVWSLKKVGRRPNLFVTVIDQKQRNISCLVPTRCHIEKLHGRHFWLMCWCHQHTTSSIHCNHHWLTSQLTTTKTINLPPWGRNPCKLHQVITSVFSVAWWLRIIKKEVWLLKKLAALAALTDHCIVTSIYFC